MPTKTLVVADREAWWAWLAANHETAKQIWSALNKKRAAKVIAEGRMTPAGAAKAGFLENPGRAAVPRKRRKVAMPNYMEVALRASKSAWENYNGLAPSYQRLYIGWIISAKKEETRQRRLAEAVALLAENRKLGLK